MDLSTLALNAGTCPSANICIDTWPHISSGDELLYSWVGEAMKGIKDGLFPLKWD